MILLDSSVLIDFFRKTNKKNTFFNRLASSQKRMSISSVTSYEVGIGNRKSHSDYWLHLCESFQVLSFDKASSEIAIAIYVDLIKQNKVIDLADIFIAATAIANKLPLATLNTKHFERIEGLELISI